LPWQRRIFAVALKPSRRGFSGTLCCLSGANILFAGKTLTTVGRTSDGTSEKSTTLIPEDPFPLVERKVTAIF
jgi:hypothetical protein